MPLPGIFAALVSSMIYDWLGADVIYCGGILLGFTVLVAGIRGARKLLVHGKI